MKNLTMKNKRIIATMGAIVITIIIFILLAPKIKTKLIGDIEVVYQLKSDIKEGEKIEDKNIIEVEKNKSNIPDNIIKDKKDIVGKYAKTDIFKDDFLFEKKLSTEEQFYNEESNLISLTLPTSTSGVSGKLKKGDVVKIFGYDENSDDLTENRVIEHPELNAVEIVSVTTSNLKEVTNLEKKEDITPTDLPSTIVFKIKSEQQMNRLVSLEHGTKIHLAFLARGKNKEKLLEDQDRMLKKLLEAEVNTETLGSDE